MLRRLFLPLLFAGFVSAAGATESGSVDILAALQWLVSQGLVSSMDVPTQLEYGVEVCYTSGPETFPLTGLTFALSQ